ANLTIDPNWSTFHPGESVTFTCDMNEGKDTDWEYEIRRNGEQFIQSDQHKSYTLQPIQIDHSGEYQCSGVRKSFSLTKCSGTVSLNVTAQPKAKLTAGPTTIPVGGSVTLSCSVEPSAGWKYRWWRRTSDTPEVQLTDENRDINVKQGGIYRCVGERGNTNFQSLVSDDVIITITCKFKFSNEVVVTRRPNWPQIFSGETITLTCEVQGGETTEWTCEWRRDRTTVARRNDKVWTVSVSESSSGDYMCQCRRRDDWRSVTKWSEKVPVSVSAALLCMIVSHPHVSPAAGGSVTLTCTVDNPGHFVIHWYRHDSESSEGQDMRNYKANKVIKLSKGGLYSCRGGNEGKGGSVSYTNYSNMVTIEETQFHPGSSLKVNPDRVQHFSSDSVSFHCEGNSADWRLMRVSETGQPSFLNSSNWGTRKQSIISNWSDGGIFWCESGLGEFSNAVNITLQSISVNNLLLNKMNQIFESSSPLTDVQLLGESLLLKTYMYVSELLWQMERKGNVIISFFIASPYSYDDSAPNSVFLVNLPAPLSSSSNVLLIVGPFSGILLIILLLFLSYYIRSKGE
uniref:Ig-like domain-containing protein n=1 Tax=Poecilia formosa TaxID=48698 RepID=A0A096LPM5_POEFO